MLYALTRRPLAYSLTSDVLLQQRELEPLLLRLLRLVGLVGLLGLGGGRGWRGLRRHGQRLGVVRRGEDGRQVRCRGRGQLDGLGLCFRDGLRLRLLNGLGLRHLRGFRNGLRRGHLRLLNGLLNGLRHLRLLSGLRRRHANGLGRRHARNASLRIHARRRQRWRHGRRQPRTTRRLLLEPTLQLHHTLRQRTLRTRHTRSDHALRRRGQRALQLLLTRLLRLLHLTHSLHVLAHRLVQFTTMLLRLNTSQHTNLLQLELHQTIHQLALRPHTTQRPTTTLVEQTARRHAVEPAEQLVATRHRCARTRGGRHTRSARGSNTSSAGRNNTSCVRKRRYNTRRGRYDTRRRRHHLQPRVDRRTHLHSLILSRHIMHLTSLFLYRIQRTRLHLTILHTQHTIPLLPLFNSN